MGEEEGVWGEGGEDEEEEEGVGGEGEGRVV